MAIVSYHELRAAGVSRRVIDNAVASGGLARVRVGWYAEPGTPEPVVAATRCGGTLTCAAALRYHGVWVGRAETHVRVDPAARVHATTHRIHRLAGDSSCGVDDPLTALAVLCACAPREEVICALDSALHLGLVTMSDVLARLTTAKGRTIVDRSDRRSESGIETLARVRLRSRGIRLRVQVPISGIGRVDIVVGDRLVIELDGDEWHSTAEQRESDRRRDSALTARGYLVLRAGYRRVMGDWTAFEREVLSIVRRDAHLWRRADPR
jgi:very-short-patch-repair endonuclease